MIDGMTTPQQPKENGLAIASLILGIVSFTGFGALTGVPAIITGVMSLKNPNNKGLGVAGLIMGIVATAITLLAILAFILLVFVFAAAAAHDGSDPALDIPESTGSSSLQRQI